MKAIVKPTPEPGVIEVKDLPMPEAGPGEVLVKMSAAGICYSDVMIYKGSYKGRVPVPSPMIMGHEGAGVVAAVGKGVENLKAGDKVGLNPLWGCGQCEPCANGQPNMCLSWRHLGITCDGTFAEYREAFLSEYRIIPHEVREAQRARRKANAGPLPAPGKASR